MSSALNLDQLATFVAVLKAGSFSSAAERLGLSQPAVSLQVRQLEKRVGAVLIERGARRLRASAAGEALLAHAGLIRAAVDAALEAVAPHRAGGTGRVHIGTGATACTFLLPPLLRQLRRQYPQADISVTTGNTADIVRDVEADRLDLGLVTLPAASRALELTPVLKDEFLLIAPPGMVLPSRPTAAALARLPFVAFEAGGNTRHLVDAWFSRAAVACRPLMSLGSVEAIKEMVGAGLGCAIVPALALNAERRAGRLQVRSLSPLLHRQLAVVVRRDKRLHRALGEALRMVKALGARRAA